MFNGACGRKNNAPSKDVCILIPEPVNTLPYDKRGFTDVIKLWVLRWKDDPESPG